MSDDSNLSQGWGGWMRWLVNTGIALITAGSSIVAVLEYFKPLDIFTVSTPTATIVAPPTSVPSFTPQPTQTSTQPAIASITPVPEQPSPTDFVLSY